MTHISEHDSEQEWEGDLREYGWVDFLIHGHSIGVDDLLKGECEVVNLDVGGWLDGVAGELLEVGGGMVDQDLSDPVLLFIGTPEIPNVGGGACLHEIDLSVDVFLLGDEPLVDFQGTDLVSCVVVVTYLIDLEQVALELLLGVFGQGLGLSDTVLHFLDFRGNSLERWEIKSLSHE